MGYNYVVRKHDSAVELYIDLGQDKHEENINIFKKLEENKEQIENFFEEKINWELLENRRACRLSFNMYEGGYRDQEKWDHIQNIMIDKMILLKKN